VYKGGREVSLGFMIPLGEKAKSPCTERIPNTESLVLSRRGQAIFPKGI
jgi:hypothetical protein